MPVWRCLLHCSVVNSFNKNYQGAFFIFGYMPALLLLFLLLQLNVFSQRSDFISVRKWSGRALKTFYAGSRISFQTKSGTPVSGVIEDIRSDSVFIVLHDVRRYQSYLGVPAFDTVATYTVPLHYKDIKSVMVSKRSRAGLVLLGNMMLYGGGGYIALNVINGGLYNQSVGGKENLRKLGIAASVFLTGFIARKHFKATRFGRHQKIVYIKLR